MEIYEAGEEMKSIAEWLQQLVAAFILAGFLEMILPNNELKGVTKMVVGLMIVLILLQPLVKFFQFPSEIAWSLSGIGDEKKIDLPSTAQIIKEGLKLRDNWTAQLQEQNQTYLKDKIKNILAMIDEIRLVDLRLNFDGPDLVKVKLKVAPVNRNIQSESFENLTKKIKNSIQLISNLGENQIEVIWDGRES